MNATAATKPTEPTKAVQGTETMRGQPTPPASKRKIPKRALGFLSALLCAMGTLACGSSADPPAAQKCLIAAGAEVDYAQQLGCVADFDALAWRPPDTSIPGARSSKTIVDTAQAQGSDPGALYLINASKYPIHYTFAQKFLSGKGKPLVKDAGSFAAQEYFSPTRRFLLGALTRYDGPKVWAWEIAPYDTMTPEQITAAWDKLVAHIPFGKELYFHPTSEALQTLSAQLPPRIRVISTDQLFKGSDFQPLNPGVAIGQLRFYKVAELDAKSRWVTPRDIAVLDAVPNDISVVAGLVTAELQTPLSHVNVLSQNRGTPNMGLKGAMQHAKLRGLENRWVRLEITAFDWKISEVTKAEADAWWQSHKPPAVKVPELDLSVAEPRDCSQVTSADVAAFGGKGANYGQLCHIKGLPVPPAIIVPVYFYHQFSQKIGLPARIQALQADQAFANDPLVREQKLAELQDFVESAPLDPAFEASLTQQIAGHFPNQRVRVRSSTNAEDLDGFTGAGLYTSKTYDPADPGKPLAKAVRQVWASLWNLRAWEERDWRGIDHQAVAMALLIHRGFPAEDANGVALTNNLFDPTQPAFYVNVQFGDTPVVRPPVEVTTDQFLYFYAYPNQPIAWMGHSSLMPAGKSVLSLAQVQELGAALNVLHEAFAPIYAKPGKFYAMDVEFKFNTDPGQGSKLWIKQARPHPGWLGQ